MSSEKPRVTTVKLSDIAAHPTMRMDAEYWLDCSENEHPITEVDVLDDEIEQSYVFVRCEECDFGDSAERMTRDYTGAWLCWTCKKGLSE